MKKYLLLAATAMLFSTNAMATTYPDLDDQTADVNVSASIIPVCQLTATNDTINFGTLYVTDADDSGEFSILMYSDDSSLDTGTNVVGTDGTTNHGFIRSTCGLNSEGGSAPYFTVSCVGNGSVENGCEINGHTNYKFTPSAGHPDHADYMNVGGTLSGPIPSSAVSISGAAVRFTLNY